MLRRSSPFLLRPATPAPYNSGRGGHSARLSRWSTPLLKSFSVASPTGLSPRDDRFSTLTVDDLDHFKSFLSPHSIVTDSEQLAPYNNDWMRKYEGYSKLALKPSTTEQVSKILKYCDDRKLALVPQGGNTGLVGGSIPRYDEIILSLSDINSIETFIPNSGIIVAEAGVTLETLQKHAESYGYMIPLDFGAKDRCQIGGNLATNAGGLKMVRDGPLRASVLGLEVVLANGEILDGLSTLRKDNTGYDLKQLFVGSEGTLGIITKVSMACVPKTRYSQTMLLALDDFSNVSGLLQLAKSYQLSSFEYMDKNCLQLARKFLPEVNMDSVDVDAEAGTSFLLVELASPGGEVVDFQRKAVENHGVAKITAAEGDVAARGLWKIRESMAPVVLRASKGGSFKYDISLPIDVFEQCILETREKVPEGEVCGWGHIGDGNLHLNIALSDRSDYEGVKDKIEPWIYEFVQHHKGSVSAEHGLGQMKKHAIGYSKSPVAIDLMRKIKNIFDPNGILNPYKVLP